MGAFGFGWAWSLLLSIPHSIAVNLVCELSSRLGSCL